MSLKLITSGFGLDKNKPNDEYTQDPNDCGEDSFFISDNFVGIADGVGGWNAVDTEPKINSAHMSRSLMNYIKQYSVHHNDQNSLHDLLEQAYNSVMQDESIDGGSSTVTILKFNLESNTLYTLDTLQLGDSSYAIIKNNKTIAFYTQNGEQLECVPDRNVFHEVPFQLAKIPVRCNHINPIQTNPREAILRHHELEENDIIIVASDGLWDNLVEDDFIDALNYYFENNKGDNNLNVMATYLISTARYYKKKPDDITLIICKLVKN